MGERIVALFSKVLFGKQYSNGFVVEKSHEKMEYRLTGLFPNEAAKVSVINVLEKASTLKLDDRKNR